MAKPANIKLIIEICEHITKYNLSYRETAKIFGINFKTVSNYTLAIKNIDYKLYKKVKKCLEIRKETSNYSHKNLKDIYDEVCNYYLCGNSMKKTSVKFESSTHSIYYLIHVYVKNNDTELYIMILDMIELNKIKSIKARSEIRKMKSIEERLDLCRIIVNEKLNLKSAKEKFKLDVKTIKSYVESIKDVDYDLYIETCKQLRVKI